MTISDLNGVFGQLQSDGSGLATTLIDYGAGTACTRTGPVGMPVGGMCSLCRDGATVGRQKGAGVRLFKSLPDESEHETLTHQEVRYADRKNKPSVESTRPQRSAQQWRAGAAEFIIPRGHRRGIRVHSPPLAMGVNGD